MLRPFISIIIPTYNRAYSLENTLKIVLNQTYRNFEIILIDNHSTDGTSNLVGRLNDKRIKFIQIFNNGIIAKSRNKGIKEAKGEFIAFLDSDDWWTENKLEIAVKYIKDGFEFIFHDLKVEPNSLSIKDKIFNKNKRQFTFEECLLYGNFIYTSSVILKKS